MTVGTSLSINGVPIRLTEERWDHIIESHPELSSFCETILDAIEDPDYILRGRHGAFAAVVHLGREAFLCVFYVEKSRLDGFIVSARLQQEIDKTKIVWRKGS